MKCFFTLLMWSFCISPAQGQEIYSANSCFNSMNPDTNFSADMSEKIAALSKGAWLRNVARFDLSLAVIEHRKTQCELKRAGKNYDTACPVGDTLLIDNFAQAAIEAHALKTADEIQKIAKTKTDELRTAGKSMLETCK